MRVERAMELSKNGFIPYLIPVGLEVGDISLTLVLADEGDLVPVGEGTSTNL
jgi:hypothetical protein